MKLFSDRSILALCFLEISASLAAGAETAPLTRLKQAHTAYEARNYDAAVRHLRAIGSELARLAETARSKLQA